MSRSAHLIALAALAIGASTAQAQKIEGSAALKARAKVSGDSATHIALRQVPNGKVQAAELEEEKGKLIYSFDIKVAGKSGIEEVAVDAVTGAVLSQEHETPEDEQKEAAADAEKAKRAAKKTPSGSR